MTDDMHFYLSHLSLLVCPFVLVLLVQRSSHERHRQGHHSSIPPRRKKVGLHSSFSDHLSPLSLFPFIQARYSDASSDFVLSDAPSSPDSLSTHADSRCSSIEASTITAKSYPLRQRDDSISGTVSGGWRRPSKVVV